MKKSFKFAIVLLLVLTTLCLFGCQKNKDRIVNGVVKCENVAVEGATVKIRNTTYETVTDDQGTFTFTIKETTDELGDFRILVTKEGYTGSSKDVLTTDFKDNKIEVVINIETNNVKIKGKVTDKDGSSLSNVKVSLNEEKETFTNENGEYSFDLNERPQGVILTFEKEGFAIKEESILDFTHGSVFEKNVSLADNLVTINGVVVNNYEGAISGAKVKIKGTDYETLSLEDGSYTFTNVLLPKQTYELEVSKDGYLTSVYDNTAYQSLELVKDYYNYATIHLNDNRTIEGFVTKSKEGIYFKYVIDDFKYSAPKEEKVQVYINPGKYTENKRLGGDGSHAIEIALTSNNGICVFVNYLGGVSFVSNILWGDEVKYETHEVNDKVELTLFVKYSVFGDYCGADFAIDDKSPIGLGLNFYSDFIEGNLGYWETTFKGVDDKYVVDHDNPSDWPRLSIDGMFIYDARNNDKVDISTKTIKGVVTSENNPLEGVLVSIASLNLTATTNINGEYEIVIPEIHSGVNEFNVSFVKDKYDLADETATFGDTKEVVLDKELVKSAELLTVSGVIAKIDGTKISGAKVNIKGTEIEVYTNENGEFVFDRVNFTTLPYTLVVSCDGFYGQEKEFTTLTPDAVSFNLEVKLPHPTSKALITLARENTKIGTLVNGAVDVFAYFNNGSLVLTYVWDETKVSIDTINQGFSFGDGLKYEVRFTNGWTGIYNCKDDNWLTWTPKVANPTFSKEGSVVTASQTIDLSYFTDNGFDITAMEFCPYVNDFRALELNNEVMLDFSSTTYWPTLEAPGVTLKGKVMDSEQELAYASIKIKNTNVEVFTNANGEFLIHGADAVYPYTLEVALNGYVTQEIEITEATTNVLEVTLVVDSGSVDTNLYINLTNTLQKVGMINVGGGDAEVRVSYENGLLTMQYVYQENALTKEMNQYFIFDAPTVYEVRFNNAAWTGVYNYTNAFFEVWNGKIGVPTYQTSEGVTTLTQVIDLSYFSDLSLNINNPKLCITCTGSEMLDLENNTISFSNPTTWMNLVYPVE